MAWTRMPERLAVLALAATLAGGAAAEPAVILDRGESRPITEYLPAAPRFPALGNTRIEPDPRLPRPAPGFPVRTQGLVPGPVQPRAVQLPQLAGRTFFLVGSDGGSKAWLSRHAGRLAALGAAGLLVQAETAQDLEAVQALVPGVPLTALDAGELAGILGLPHYPVLVSAGRIEQ